MFSLFIFSSIFPGGQLTPFAPMCGRPWIRPVACCRCRVIWRALCVSVPLCACTTASPANTAQPIEKQDCSDGLHIGATWRIRVNVQCEAAMRHYVRLLRLLAARFRCCLRSFSGDGVLMCSIDNMPAQLPRESTEYFGSLLMPHVIDIVSRPPIYTRRAFHAKIPFYNYNFQQGIAPGAARR